MHSTHCRFLVALVLIVSASLAACGDDDGPRRSSTYSVGGTVTGLTGGSLVLSVSGGGDVTIAANGPATFASGLADRAAFTVTIRTQPAAPPHNCTLSNATGTIAATNVTNVNVVCTRVPLTLVSSTPANAAMNTDVAGPFYMTFSVPLAATPSPASALTLRRQAGDDVSFGAVASGAQVSVTPDLPLALLTSYSLTAGTTLRGAAGESLAAAATVSFTTRDGAWRSPTPVEVATGNASHPQVAHDAAGNAFAVWQQLYGGTLGTNIWASRYVAASGWGLPQLISTGNTGFAFAPKIAVDAEGNALVVWQQQTGAEITVRANRYVANVGWGNSQLLGTGGNAAFATSPRIAGDAAGNAVAVWEEQGATSIDLWASRYLPGTGWGLPQLVETGDAGDAHNADIAIAADGVAFVVWDQSDGTNIHVWSNRFVPGAGWGQAQRIETGDAGSSTLARVAVDAGGNALVVWQRSSGPDLDVWFNRHALQTGWGSPVRINASGADYAILPRLAVDAGGNALAVWVQSDGVIPNIWSSRFTPASGWAAAALIEQVDTGTANDPSVSVDSAGNALAVWHQYDGTYDHIWAARFKPNAGWGAPQLLETNNLGSAFEPQIAIDPSGRALAIWQQSNGASQDDIWAAIFD